jgi:hypothetical protein
MNKELTIQQGSVSFWIKEKAVNFSDGKITRFFEVNPDGGSILCVKDSDNKLKVLFVVLGKGRVDIEHDVSGLDIEKRHMVVFTWSLESRELKLYLDGKIVQTQTISF